MGTKQKKSLMSCIVGSFVVLSAIVTTSTAAAPDLTNGGTPGDTLTFNLGPTGARGWAYHVKVDTSESRQILVTAVDAGSPASGILAADDVILGVSGTGANPSNFSSDARKSLGLAIADAEASSPAALKLLRWRSGTTTTVTLTLQELGAYSATAPYNCPKSTLILNQGLQYVYDNETDGRYSFGAITLLANGNSTYQAKAETTAHALIPSQSTMDYMMSDERDASSMITWQRGHALLFLAEYYLATNDALVLPAIEAYAVNIAKNRSLFGTVGHIFAEKNDDGSANGPMGGVYGVVNSAGMPCFLGVLLAKECGLTNPELDPAIEASSRFFAYYSGKGAIPYGEHEPYIAHESNGKSGLGALYFSLQNNRDEEGKFFAKMATASGNERELGHTGAWFNYLWAPLGAAAGGEEAAASYFSGISWMLDLNRRWDGGFDYDCLNGEGPNSGSEYNDFRMSTAALLTYALPERKLRITGKGHDAGRYLSSADVTEAVQANDYDADPRSDSQLISDLGNWSPKVRSQAATELGTRSIDATELSQITAMANDTGATSHSRAGACLALGKIGDSSSAGPLAALLTDADNYVRWSSAEAMRYLPRSANLVHVDTILAAAASTAAPLYPVVEEDPLQFAHGKLGMLLFYSWSAFGPKGILWDSLDGIDRNLLYPAVEAIAQTPVGVFRGTLERAYDNMTYADVLAMSGTIADSVTNRAPADKMFSNGVRRGGVAAFQKHGIAEGVPVCMAFVADEVGGRRNEGLEQLGTFGGSVHTVEPDPDALGFLTSYLSDGETAATAQASLDAINNDSNPVTLNALKSIDSATADDPIVDVTENSTTLRVNATDHAQGDSVYTWSKLSGPGTVIFSSNGTAATASTIIFDGTLGTYQFEVTMSDSRGLTEAYKTVTVELVDGGGPDVTAPIPDPLTWASAPGSASVGPVVYEGFDYTGGTNLTGNGGAGFDGAWSTTRNNNGAGYFGVNSTGLSFTDASSNTLPVAGNSADRTTSSGRSEANRVLSAEARSVLFADGTTMWFSALYTKTDSSENSGFVIGTDTFNLSGWELSNYASGGEGFGFGSSADLLVTALGYDNATGLSEVDSTVSTTGVKLIAGKIVWSASGSNDTLYLYDVTDLTTEPTNPIAIVTADTNQAAFDRISFLGNKAGTIYDEIRLGTTFASVTGEAGNSETSVTMTATTAFDPSGVEYYFTSTSGGGHDSGWQDSPDYTDTGLTPGTEYTYTVTARDKSGNQNTTAPSSEASVTTGGINPNLPLKVFILAGQSNMEGHGEMNPIGTQGTLEYLFDYDPETYGHLKNGGSWATRDDVWIWYKRGGTTLLSGGLSAGFGAYDWTIGPELQFGHAIGEAYGERVLIIKTAWGGKSLYNEFRPPSSGWSVTPPVVDTDQGYYYQEMINYVNDVLGNLPTYFPEYNAANGYELAGFGWHQGWNDRVNQAATDEYQVNMENFINDVRDDLGVADLPFVIANTGMGGWEETHPRAIALMEAQLAMEDFTTYPAFSGNVAVVETRGFWRDPAESPSTTQSYHWNRNAETYFLIGQAMAEEMQILISGEDVLPPTPNPATFAAAPTADSDTAISMTATTGSDVSGPVEYLFTETSGNSGGTTSDWQTSPSYTDSGLISGLTYRYTVTMRDSLGNTGIPSAEASAKTLGGPDTDPPTPNPASFASVPAADSDTSISMTATTGSDETGPVEYLFTATSGNAGATSSGWQSSASYTDNGLSAGAFYTYTVTMRDSLGNTGTVSASASANTPGGPVTVVAVTGHDGGNWPATLGHLTDMINGVNPGSMGEDHNPGMDTSADATDPSTWTLGGSQWAEQWLGNSRLDPTSSSNNKIGWAALDFGGPVADLENLHLWNSNTSQSGEHTNTYNVYYATSLTASLPAMPNSQSIAGDYDFASGGWTLLNTGAPLTLSRDDSYNVGPQAVLELGRITARYIGIEILTAGNGTGPGRVGLGQVEVTTASSGGGNDFIDWIGGYTLTDASFNGDDDGDNLVNGIEALFGTEPDVANLGLAQVSQSGAVTSFTHPMAEPQLDNVTGSYQWSIDLVNWHPSGTAGDTTVMITAGAPVSGTTTVTADTTGSAVNPAQLFIRVVATENP